MEEGRRSGAVLTDGEMKMRDVFIGNAAHLSGMSVEFFLRDY